MKRHGNSDTVFGVEMPPRRRFRRRLKSGFVHFIPIGGLLLWAGMITAAWFSLDKPAPETVAKASPPAPAIEMRQPPDLAADPPAVRQSAAVRPADDDGLAAPGRQAAEPAQAKTALAAPAQPAAVASAGRQPGGGTALAGASTQTSASADTAAGARAEDEHSDASPPADARVAQADAPAQAVESAENSAPPAKPPAPVSSPHVTRAQFTTGIENREPVDRVERVFHSRNEPLRRLYYFTELSDLRGRTVTHSWEHEGRVIAKVTFHVGGNHWRVYSSKRLTASMTGRWRVVVTDGDGNTIKTDSFVYKTP